MRPGIASDLLEPHRLAVEQWVRPARDIARRHDAGRGQAGLVAHDAVGELEPGRRQPVGRGRDADAHHDHVGLDRGSVAQVHALDAFVALDRVDLYAGAEVDPVVAMHVGDHLAELRPTETESARRDAWHLTMDEMIAMNVELGFMERILRKMARANGAQPTQVLRKVRSLAP